MMLMVVVVTVPTMSQCSSDAGSPHCRVLAAADARCQTEGLIAWSLD